MVSAISASNDSSIFAASPVQSESSAINAKQGQASREQSHDSGMGGDGGSSPTLSKTSSHTTRPQSSTDTLSKLHPDIQRYIRYAKENMTPYHWNYAPDGSTFLMTALFEAAMRYEPLLYAVVCFAAYHHTLSKADGRMEDFLTWHSKSVAALAKSLHDGDRHTIATLLTILQLATIEVCKRFSCNTDTNSNIGITWGLGKFDVTSEGSLQPPY